MFKIFGMAAVMTSALMTGFGMANQLKERTNALRELHQYALHIRTDLEYRAADIGECFKGRGKLFSQAYTYMEKEHFSPKDALMRSCKEISYLNKEDRDIIEIYSGNLENEDLGGQIANVTWLIENIFLKIKESEAEYQSKSRLYRSGSIIVGFGSIILLL